MQCAATCWVSGCGMVPDPLEPYAADSLSVLGARLIRANGAVVESIHHFLLLSAVFVQHQTVVLAFRGAAFFSRTKIDINSR